MLNKYRKYILVLLAVIFIFAFFVWTSESIFCTNDEHKNFISADAVHTAELYRSNCIGKADYSGHIKLDGKKIFKLNHFDNNITVEWITNTHLFVQYAYKNSNDDVSILKKEHGGVSIEYFYWPCIGPIDKYPQGYCLE